MAKKSCTSQYRTFFIFNKFSVQGINLQSILIYGIIWNNMECINAMTY